MYIPKPHARSYLLVGDSTAEKGLRIYRNDPHSINMIIYTATEKQKRISIASITRKEALEIAAYLNRKAEELSDE